MFWVFIPTIMFSCEDYLEVVPENAVTFRDFFNTEADLEVFTNGIREDYKWFVQSGLIRVIRGSIYDDGSSYYTRWVDLDPVKYAPNSTSYSWMQNYKIISGANILLRYYQKPGLSTERENYYKGIAHFYRGYSYGNIGMLWGDAPIVKFDGDVGMKAKESWEDVIDFAIEDAKEAALLLPAIDELKDLNDKKITTRDTPSKEAAYALLAHLYAWKAAMLNDNDELLAKAIDAATKVINSSNIELAASVEEVCTSVLVENSRESIFESQLLASENNYIAAFYTINPYLSYPVDPSAGEGDIKWTDLVLNNSRVESMYTNADERKTSYFYNFDEQKAKSEAITGGFAYPYKIRRVKINDRWGGYDYILQNAVVYRLSELILLRAECYAKRNQSGLAIADLNEIRGRANADLYQASEGDVQYMVFKEREKELLWEGHRYFDVVRNGYWKTELKGAFKTFTDSDVKNGGLYLPVSQGAFDDNPLMTQNTYWLGKY